MRHSASVKAMQQIASAIVATTFVLLSIFIPVGPYGRYYGKIYQQFAVTIATAVVFSAFNALHPQPVALCHFFFAADRETEPHGFFKCFERNIDFFKKPLPEYCRLFLKPAETTALVNARNHCRHRSSDFWQRRLRFCRKKIRALSLPRSS